MATIHIVELNLSHIAGAATSSPTTPSPTTPAPTTTPSTTNPTKSPTEPTALQALKTGVRPNIGFGWQYRFYPFLRRGLRQNNKFKMPINM